MGQLSALYYIYKCWRPSGIPSPASGSIQRPALLHIPHIADARHCALQARPRLMYTRARIVEHRKKRVAVSDSRSSTIEMYPKITAKDRPVDAVGEVDVLCSLGADLKEDDGYSLDHEDCELQVLI